MQKRDAVVRACFGRWVLRTSLITSCLDCIALIMLAIETGDVITLIGVAQVVRRELGVGELGGGAFSKTLTQRLSLMRSESCRSRSQSPENSS